MSTWFLAEQPRIMYKIIAIIDIRLSHFPIGFENNGKCGEAHGRIEL